jgi:O-acetylhomoserine/O-acetylserine sulfhydrylase-like pyridoxal-dependent enzyme
MKISQRILLYLLSKTTNDIYELPYVLDDYIYGEGYTKYFDEVFKRLDTENRFEIEEKWENTPLAVRANTIMVFNEMKVG